MPSSHQQGDGRLWLAAFGCAAVAHLALVPLIGLCLLKADRPQALEAKSPDPERLMTLQFEIEPAEPQPKVAATLPKPPAKVDPPKQFARTSPDQAAPPERETPFIGERNTRATSDLPPTPNAPALPSQRGIEREDREMETTESRYQDGELAPTPPSPTPGSIHTTEPLLTGPRLALPTEAPASPKVLESLGVEPVTPALPNRVQGESKPASPKEHLAESSMPVDRLVPREKAPDLPPVPQQPPEQPRRSVTETPPASAATSSPSTTKPFQGNQRKTAIVGSISRTGRSALDVEDSALGRYQALISRAVELEWQRNCVRHRDFITPGFLTVRFFVESSGKIRSVQFVGDMETGEVQKGFTLNSIRDAAIPPMPADLRGAYAEEPLELIFRFYF
ncbi:MAG TPA: hypothetical protein VFY13_04640 [Luteolibacter sp.]|nr:hypothetical protein [Luteolibacter sp.]